MLLFLFLSWCKRLLCYKQPATHGNTHPWQCPSSSLWTWRIHMRIFKLFLQPNTILLLCESRPYTRVNICHISKLIRATVDENKPNIKEFAEAIKLWKPWQNWWVLAGSCIDDNEWFVVKNLGRIRMFSKDFKQQFQTQQDISRQANCGQHKREGHGGFTIIPWRGLFKWGSSTIGSMNWRKGRVQKQTPQEF